MPERSSAGLETFSVLASRCIFGGLPNRISIGISIGVLAKWLSSSVKWRSSVASPTTA
ncbi:Uncharacterised protein [Vibrio cholerae]|uniref:Uncharacterized protein n=1 Tax=Vibrio cholerae TaxID=666 RepID=A0A655ZEP9_VIBCL|nr:Uncharacterised protein [Vibrio cholerae]